MFAHTRTQRPVGHGFFHSGSIETGKLRFEYVYDCGSESKDALTREIESYAADLGSVRISCLFVSHLDRDHSNGLSRLLNRVTPDCVVLPYLSRIERIAMLIEEDQQPTPDPSYRSLLPDPTEWFGERGVGIVIYVIDEDEPASSAVDLQSTHIESDLHGDSLHLSVPPGGQTRILQTGTGQVTREYVVRHSDPLTITDGHIDLAWGFVPFVAANRGIIEGFRQKVQAMFPDADFGMRDLLAINQRWLADILKSPQRRKELSAAYTAMPGGRNATSLVLYSGPLRFLQKNQYFFGAVSGDYWNTNPLTIRVGWLGTGDLNLQNKAVRERLLRRLEPVNGYVHTIALPHHAADRNYHSDILCLGASFYTAGVASNGRYGHPGPDVCAQLRAQNKIRQSRLFLATEDQDTGFYEVITVYDHENFWDNYLPLERNKFKGNPSGSWNEVFKDDPPQPGRTRGR